MPAGRPTEYKPEYCDVLIKEMSEGASLEEVACEIGISKQTMYNWFEKHKEFMDAKKEGEAKSKGWWLKQGRINLKDKEFLPTLWYMNMKNRHGWTDKQSVQQDTTININTISYKDE